jgi:hypothetical protein
MIYNRWMSFIKDDVRLKSLVIPGSHNACTRNFPKISCCQNDDVYTQIQYGIRHFCIRLDTVKRGEIVTCHGLSKGEPFRNVLECFKKALEENETEFFILDIREYYPQKFGPFTFRYKAEPAKVNLLLKEYIEPEKYAFTEFDDISKVTMGDIRKSGKRYLLLNYRQAYDYSLDCPYIFPWEKKVNGSHAEDFVNETLRFFDDYRTDGLYWFQTQQTPNFGVPVGLTTPVRLDEELRPYFRKLIDGIASNPFYLESANIIAGDFMTRDYMKVREILRLNILKGNCIQGMEDEYHRGLEEGSVESYSVG